LSTISPLSTVASKATRRIPLVAGAVAAAAVGAPILVLMGVGALGIAVAAPAAAGAYVAGRKIAEKAAQPSRSSADFQERREDRTVTKLMLQEIQSMIDEIDRVHSRCTKPEAVAAVERGIAASQVILKKLIALEEGEALNSKARRVHRKLRSFRLILTRYEDLVLNRLLAEDEVHQSRLITRVEQDALPQIASQLAVFARTMDEQEIDELEVELEALRRLDAEQSKKEVG
jgi:hypothetical protein